MPKTKVKTHNFSGQVVFDAKLGINRKSGADLTIKVDVGSPYTIIKSSFLTMNNITILKDLSKQMQIGTANVMSSIDIKRVQLKGNLYIGEVVFINPIVYVSDSARNNLLGIDYIACCKTFEIDFHEVNSIRVSNYCYFDFDGNVIKKLASRISKSKLGSWLNIDDVSNVTMSSD